MLHKHFQRLLTVVTSAGLVLGSMGDAWAAKAPNATDNTPNNAAVPRNPLCMSYNKFKIQTTFLPDSYLV